MLNPDYFIFIFAFCAAFIIFRSIIYLISKPLDEIGNYTRQGPKIHHMHVGFMVIFIGILVLLVSGKSVYSLLLLGFGCGMVIDEFIASLYIPESEPLVSSLYRKSFTKTLVVNIILVLLVLILAIISNYK